MLASVGDGVFFVDRGGVVRTGTAPRRPRPGLRATTSSTGPPSRRSRAGLRSSSRVADRRARARARRARSRCRSTSAAASCGSRSTGSRSPDGIVYAFRDLTEERALETHAHRVRLDGVARAAHAARRDLRRGDDAPAQATSRSTRTSARRCSTSSPDEADRLARTVNDILWASRLDTDTLHVTIQNCDPLALARDVVDGAAGAPRPPGTSSSLELDDRAAARRRRPGQGRPVLDQPRRQRRSSTRPTAAASTSRVAARRRARPLLGHRRGARDPALRAAPDLREVLPPRSEHDPRRRRHRASASTSAASSCGGWSGRIWVESRRPGRGSTFHVELPVAALAGGRRIAGVAPANAGTLAEPSQSAGSAVLQRPRRAVSAAAGASIRPAGRPRRTSCGGAACRRRRPSSTRT